MEARDTDEILSFGTYPSATDGRFAPHASLHALPNGSLTIKGKGVTLLPGGGDSFVGSGKTLTVPSGLRLSV